MQALKKLHSSIKQSKSLKQFISFLQKVPSATFLTMPEQFSVSKLHEQICSELQKTKLTQIEQAFKNLPPIPQITAIIIKSSKQYTLALLMIPQNRYFGWHDHSKMNGISRIVAGDLYIRSINPEHMYKFIGDAEGNTFCYPIDRIRQEVLRPNAQRISTIYPDSFNIHEIFGTKQSCFLDLLIPEYPDNSCHYFQTCDEPIIQGQIQDKIKIRRINSQFEQIIGLDSLAKYFRQKQNIEKRTINNIIVG